MLQKNVNLILVAFNAMMTTFIAAGVIPAFELFSIDLGISLTQASYLTSIQILILGLSPLFWKPISNRFGRRPIWLISTFCSMICNIGCAESHSYASQVVTRILVAFFISPAIAISSAVVTETFFANQRTEDGHLDFDGYIRVRASIENLVHSLTSSKPANWSLHHGFRLIPHRRLGMDLLGLHYHQWGPIHPLLLPRPRDSVRPQCREAGYHNVSMAQIIL